MVYLSIAGTPGFAGGAPPLHPRPWPIYDGRNHQPTQRQLNDLHVHDVTPEQAQEVDRLYDEFLTNSKNAHATSGAQALSEDRSTVAQHRHAVSRRPYRTKATTRQLRQRVARAASTISARLPQLGGSPRRMF